MPLWFLRVKAAFMSLGAVTLSVSAFVGILDPEEISPAMFFVCVMVAAVSVLVSALDAWQEILNRKVRTSEEVGR
jgi:hypothetical protein